MCIHIQKTHYYSALRIYKIQKYDLCGLRSDYVTDERC